MENHRRSSSVYFPAAPVPFALYLISSPARGGEERGGRGGWWRCTHDPKPAAAMRRTAKVKATIHWVGAADAVTAKVRPLQPALQSGTRTSQLCRRAQSGTRWGAARTPSSNLPLLATIRMRHCSSSAMVIPCATGSRARQAGVQPHVGLRDTWAKVARRAGRRQHR